VTGRLAQIYRRAVLHRRGVVLRRGARIEHVRFLGTALLEPDCLFLGQPEIVLGRNFYANACTDVRGDVVFGDDVLLGPKVVIWDHCDPAAPTEEGASGREARAPVRIGDDVWIAASCVVVGGVTVGSGAVVGAGSVVVEDVPPQAIAVGNPARVVRYRSTSD